MQTCIQILESNYSKYLGIIMYRRYDLETKQLVKKIGTPKFKYQKYYMC